MVTAPFGVRLLVGAAVTALQETRKLPQTVLTYPMTVVSQVAALVMKVQQDVAGLVNKGDETLDHFFPPKDERPEWATFDEDDDHGIDAAGAGAAGAGAARTDAAGADAERSTEGRFALYSTGEPDSDASARKSVPKSRRASAAPPSPAIATELDYASLTLAQLRARLSSLRLTDLEALLTYEEQTKARAPFQTLLANRITRATAK